MKLSKMNIMWIVVSIIISLTSYFHFRNQELKQKNENNTSGIVVAPVEVVDNANRLCKSMWPGAEDVQDKCVYEQIEAGKKIHEKYIKYIINNNETTPSTSTTPQEKEHIVRKCLEYGQTILYDNSFALDYVETLKCCEYSFIVWGFEKSSLHPYIQDEK